MEHDQSRFSTSIARYAGLGALTGLLLGLLEAIYLSHYTRPPGLLKPNVTWVIWFLGPLLDGTAGGILGSLTGRIMTARQSFPAGRRVAEVLCAHGIVAIVSVICVTGFVLAHALLGNEHALRFLKVTTVLLLPLIAHELGKSVRLKILGVTLGSALFILLVGVGVYCMRPPFQTSVAAAGPLTRKGKPNIILITLDTVRADHLSLYGYSCPTTPNIDRLARGGVVFENAIAPTSWTLASHASMFTGLLPHQHGADWQIPLNTRRWTLADVLGSWGYETAVFTSNVSYGEAGWGLDEGFDLYQDNRVSLLHNLEVLEFGRRIFGPLYRRWVWPASFEHRNASQVNRDILNWFRRRSPRPFFLFTNYFDAHFPYLTPRNSSRGFGDMPPELIRKISSAFTTSDVVHLSDPDRTSLIAGYDNSLAALDGSVAELLNFVSHLPDGANTVVIITSDHGEGLGEHGTYWHGSNLHAEAVHVPLVILGPGIPKGLRISHLAPIQDLFSTVLEFAGEGAVTFSGTGLQRYWTPGAVFGKLDAYAISELTPKYNFTGLLPQMSLRTDEWAYIRNSQGDEELYDWRRDPAEQVNLAPLADYRQIRERLYARLRNSIGESLRPWQRPQYLSALDEPRRPFVNFVGSFAELASAQHEFGPPIGEAQDRFPPRAVVSSGLLRAPDSDLLQSLPYH